MFVRLLVSASYEKEGETEFVLVNDPSNQPADPEEVTKALLYLITVYGCAEFFQSLYRELSILQHLKEKGEEALLQKKLEQLKEAFHGLEV